MPVKPNQSVETAMRVLEAVADEQPAGVSALARLLDLDKNATQRALVSLGHAGWIRQAADDPGAWELTSRSLKVGHRFAPTLVQRARPRLEALHEATGETVVMMAREGDRMVAVDSVESSQPLRLSVPIGMDVPLQRSGAVDAFLPADERAALELPSSGDEPSEAALLAIRRAGYYVLDEEYPSSVAVGAPVLDARGRVVACFLVVAPRSRLSRQDRRRVGELTKAEASAVFTR